MKELIGDLLRAVLRYLLLVVGGTFIFMILALSLGYTPWSDPPGRYYFTRVKDLSWASFSSEVKWCLQWSVFTVPFALIVALLTFIIIRGLARSRVHRIVVRSLAILLASFGTGYIYFGIAWYMNLSAGPIYFAVLMGAGYGACLLRRNHTIRQAGV